MAIAGWGIAVDHVISDYVAGAAERLLSVNLMPTDALARASSVRHRPWYPSHRRSGNTRGGMTGRLVTMLVVGVAVVALSGLHLARLADVIVGESHERARNLARGGRGYDVGVPPPPCGGPPSGRLRMPSRVCHLA